MTAVRSEVPRYLRAGHFAIDATATVAFFLPAAAMRKLQSRIATTLPCAYDYTHTHTDVSNTCS